MAPSYLSSLVELYVPARNLRSSSKVLLKPKITNFKKLGERSFSFCAPNVWNKLPFSITSEKSLEAFKKKLKTHYFKEAYNV